MTPNRVMIAYDGSPAAQVAARVAIEIAAARQMEIHGLYVVDEALALDSYARPEQELGVERGDLSRSDLIAAFERQGSRALEWLEAEAAQADVPATTDILAGGVPELVLREADGAQILALGRRGNTHAADPDALGRYFLNVAHHADPPLLVGGAVARSLHRLLVVGHGESRMEAELLWAARLQQALSTDVLVLAVDAEPDPDPPQDGWKEINTALEASDLERYELVAAQGEGEPAAQIAAVAASRQVDLIITERYRHGAFVEWLLGSVVDRVLRATSLPVLLV